MKKNILLILLAGISSLSLIGAVGCKEQKTLPAQVINGGFESGDLSGWIVEYGDAYDDDSVSSRSTFSYAADIDPQGYVLPINKTGNWYLSGKGFDDTRPSSCTGAIRSRNFVLGGDGQVMLKLAGGAAAKGRSDDAEAKPLSEVCYLGIYRASDDKMIAFQTNRYFAEDSSNIELEDYLNGTCYTDNFCEYKIDLSDYIGEEIYIRVVDNDTSSYYGYLSVDDIRIGKNSLSQTEGVYYTKSAQRKNADSESIYEITNGDFECGSLYGWEILEGSAFSDDGVNCNPYWWAEQIPYEREGNFHYGYYNPTAVGRMRSKVFTLGGVGYITYKLGGCADKNTTYLKFMKVNDDGGEEILRVSNFAFKDMQFPNVQNGLRVLNLNQYRLDLREYIGSQLYIEVVDENPSDNMAGCIVLDSVKTYHDRIPIFKDWFDVEYKVKEEVIIPSEYQVKNGGFEKGLADWEQVGDLGEVTEQDTWWNEKLPFNKSGKAFFSGLNNERGRGSLTSSLFTVGGRGIMTFKLGGAHDPRFCYISLLERRKEKRIVTKTIDGKEVTEEIEVEIDAEVARYSNNMFFDAGLANINTKTNLANMVTYKADISKWLGKQLRIQIVDNADSNWGLITCDSFITYYTDEDYDKFPIKTFEAINILELEDNPYESEYQVKNGSFERGDLTDWEIVGNIGNISYDYLWWHEWYTYNKSGQFFFSGFSGDEGAKGTLTSSPFTVGGSGYITYRLGGGMDNSLCYVEIIDAAEPQKVYYRFGNERFLKNGGVYIGYPITIGCEGFGANMVLYKADLRRIIGKQVKIRLVDNATKDWGLLFADDFITYYEDANALPENAHLASDILPPPEFKDVEYDRNFAYMNYDQNKITVKSVNDNVNYSYVLTLAEVDDKESLKGITFENGVLTIIPQVELNLDFKKKYEIKLKATIKDLTREENNETQVEFTVTVNAYYENKQVLNGNFETGDLLGWEVVSGRVHEDIAVGADKTFWGEEITYNQGGKYHFDGWSAQYEEKETYALRSTKFTLGGVGYISFKLGGRVATLKVYKADGTQIALYKNKGFKNDNFPFVDKGCMLATMTTFVADLHEYIGEQLYIEICDADFGIGEPKDFGIAMFDDIVTYYEKVPDIANCKDAVELNERTSSTGKPCVYEIKWLTAENVMPEEESNNKK